MKYSRHLAVSITAAVLLIPPLRAMHGGTAALVIQRSGRPKALEPSWEVKYSSGALGLKKDQWLKAAFISGSLPKQVTKPAILISVDQIRALYFDAKAEKDSELMQGMSRSGCAYANIMMPQDIAAHPPGTFMAWMIAPGSMKRATERLNGRYPIRIAWHDETDKEFTFTVNFCEYASFLANLRWFSGQRWKELEHNFPK